MVINMCHMLSVLFLCGPTVSEVFFCQNLCEVVYVWIRLSFVSEILVGNSIKKMNMVNHAVVKFHLFKL